MKYATPLHLDLQSSRHAAGWLIPIHVAGVAVLPMLDVPAWLKILMLLAVLVSMQHNWSLHVTRRHRSAVRSFTWRRGMQCVVRSKGGVKTVGTLADRAIITPWFVVLYYRCDARLSSLFILPDMLPVDVFRRLRVRLVTEACYTGSGVRVPADVKRG